MKSTIFTLAFAALSHTVLAQHPIASQKRVFFSAGFVTPQFLQGTELLQASTLRTEGLSYFQRGDGTRRNTGTYGANSGFSLSIGYHIPVKKVDGLSLGLLVNSGQTGATPSEAGYEEGYFFNFLNFSGGAQYFPFKSGNLYAKGEIGMGSVFTKNRFINGQNEQDFLHHFGIGLSGGLGFGHAWTPFSDKGKSIYLEGLYQLYQTRVEVSGIGNDSWRFGALHLAIGFTY